MSPSSSLDFIWDYIYTASDEVTEKKTENHQKAQRFRLDREKIEKLERACSNRGVSVVKKSIRIV